MNLYLHYVSFAAILSKYDLLQPQTIEKDYRLQKNRQQWAQFRNDLNNTLHWLDDAERHMANQRLIPTSTLKLVKAINGHKVRPFFEKLLKLLHFMVYKM